MTFSILIFVALLLILLFGGTGGGGTGRPLSRDVPYPLPPRPKEKP